MLNTADAGCFGGVGYFESFVYNVAMIEINSYPVFTTDGISSRDPVN